MNRPPLHKVMDGLKRGCMVDMNDEAELVSTTLSMAELFAVTGLPTAEESISCEDLKLPYPVTCLHVGPHPQEGRHEFAIYTDLSWEYAEGLQEQMKELLSDDAEGLFVIRRVLLQKDGSVVIVPIATVIGNMLKEDGSIVPFSHAFALKGFAESLEGSEWDVEDVLDQTNRAESHLLNNFLSFLHCRNIETEVVKASVALNKSRKKKKRYPIVDYHTLVLKKSNGTTVPLASLRNREDSRLHKVRGHFKRCKTGKYWWAPHVRGNREKGEVVKDYRVDDE